MIVTLTFNTGIDHTLFLPSFKVGKTNRVTHSAISMGAKPTDVSYILGRLGVPSLAMGFAAGQFGKRMEQMLVERGVNTHFTWVNGETRLNTVIVNEDDHCETTITTSTLVIEPEHIAALRHQYETILDQASCLVLGGTPPKGIDPNVYTEFITLARLKNVPVIFDASGPALRAGLLGLPDFVKPNRTELEELTGNLLPELADVYQAAKQVHSQYGSIVVVTLGKEGALAVMGEKDYRIPAAIVEPVSTAGAGDGVLAGLALAIAHHEPIENGLRLGMAIAGAVVRMAGTADCRSEDVARLLPEIKLIPYTA